MSNMIALPTVIPSKAIQTFSGGNYAMPISVAAIPGNYIKPDGTLSINADGTFDTKKFAAAMVNVGRKFQQGSFTLTADTSTRDFYIGFEPVLFCLIQSAYSSGGTGYKVFSSCFSKSVSKTLAYDERYCYSAAGEYTYHADTGILNWTSINTPTNKPLLSSKLSYNWCAIA